MHKGTLSSYQDINFKYEILLNELPFHMSRKIKNEAYVFSNIEKKKINIEIDCHNDVLYCRTSQAFLIVEIDDIKTKCNLKNVTLNKIQNNLYELQFENIQLL